MAQDVLLQALFEHVKRPNREAVIQQLPEDLQQRCTQGSSLHVQSLADVFPDPLLSLRMVHPSWYEEVLGYSPKALQAPLKRLFSNGFGQLDANRSPIAEFLLHYAVRRWPDCNKQPVETLQNHPYFWVLRLDEQSMLLIISLLAVHDITESVRKIVDKKTLHGVLVSLSSIQQRYLRTLLQRKGEGPLTKLSCQELLDADEGTAENLLLECGYCQLGQILSGQDDLFYWHLYHRMDKNFAAQLQEKIQGAKCLQDKSVLERRLKSVHGFLNRGKRL
jgi:hypothetical protein